MKTLQAFAGLFLGLSGLIAATPSDAFDNILGIAGYPGNAMFLVLQEAETQGRYEVGLMVDDFVAGRFQVADRSGLNLPMSPARAPYFSRWSTAFIGIRSQFPPESGLEGYVLIGVEAGNGDKPGTAVLNILGFDVQVIKLDDPGESVGCRVNYLEALLYSQVVQGGQITSQRDAEPVPLPSRPWPPLLREDGPEVWIGFCPELAAMLR